MEQNVDTSAPVTPVAPVVENKQKGRNGLKIAVVVACIVAVAGIVFGIITLLQALKKDEQITQLNQQLVDCTGISNNSNITGENETICSNEVIAEVADGKINNYLAQTIVDPYLVYFGRFRNIFDHDFDTDAKMKIAFDNLGPENIILSMTTDQSVVVSYDSLNAKYQDLFGRDQEIEKRSYDSPYLDLSFENDLFKISFGGIGGTGGTMFSIVKEARYNNDELVVDVYHDTAPWCETIENRTGDDYCVDAYSGGKSENVYNLIKNFSDKIPVYMMTFAKDDWHYVLKDVQKK